MTPPATSQPVFHVNAFCTTADDGNPAGVCLLAAAADAPWMQDVARRMNLSETAFVTPSGESRFAIRWFTPRTEMPLCGHATLASAHVLFTLDPTRPPRIEFVSATGLLAAERGDDGGIALDFPAVECEPADVPDWFERAFGIRPSNFLSGPAKYLAELPSDDAVRALTPDFALLRKAADRGVIVTSRASSGDYDIVSRYFAAYVGVDEDPVTGSAHCCLGPYWSARLGKSELRAFQASPRGGALRVRVRADRRITLIGAARTVQTRTFTPPATPPASASHATMTAAPSPADRR